MIVLLLCSERYHSPLFPPVRQRPIQSVVNTALPASVPGLIGQ